VSQWDVSTRVAVGRVDPVATESGNIIFWRMTFPAETVIPVTFPTNGLDSFEGRKLRI
jgi:hypothetical protein